MTRQAEARRSAAIVERLNELPATKAIKLHGSAFAEAGTPDIHVTHRGRSFWLETKMPGEGPTKIQEKRLSQWSEAGAVVGIVHSVDEALALVRAP